MTINYVNWYSAALEVVVSGSGFGTHAAYNGVSDFITLFDITRGTEVGHTGDQAGLNVVSWTDTNLVFFYPTSGPFPFGVSNLPLDSARITIVGTNGPQIDTSTITIHEPTSLRLSSSSDSGNKGDNITNIVTPTITGSGDAGDTVTLYDTNGTTVLGTATVSAGGGWSITTSPLIGGTPGLRHNLTASETDTSGHERNFDAATYCDDQAAAADAFNRDLAQFGHRDHWRQHYIGDEADIHRYRPTG